MSAIISAIIGILTGKAGEKIGGAVADAFQVGALVTALAPLALWLHKNGDDIFIALTYKDLAFWGVILGAFMFVTTRILHRAPPPQ